MSDILRKDARNHKAPAWLSPGTAAALLPLWIPQPAVASFLLILHHRQSMRKRNSRDSSQRDMLFDLSEGILERMASSVSQRIFFALRTRCEAGNLWQTLIFCQFRLKTKHPQAVA